MPNLKFLKICFLKVFCILINYKSKKSLKKNLKKQKKFSKIEKIVILHSLCPAHLPRPYFQNLNFTEVCLYHAYFQKTYIKIQNMA